MKTRKIFFSNISLPWYIKLRRFLLITLLRYINGWGARFNFNSFTARISMIFVLFAMNLTPCYLKLEYKVTHFWKDYELSFSKMFVLFIYNISACSWNYIFCRSFYEKRRKIWISRFFSNFSAYIENFYLLR